MRIPYAFHLTSIGSLEITENEAKVVQIIFDYYLAGASLGKVVDNRSRYPRLLRGWL